MDRNLSFSPPAVHASKRLARALKAEADGLRERARVVTRDRDGLQLKVAGLTAELQAIDERLVLISSLLSGDPGGSEPTVDDSDGHPELRGPAIRMTAVALLRDRPEASGPIHYRDWLALLRQAGYEVGGQKPAATFLSQIGRSPVVRRTSRPGHYQLDRDAPTALRRRQAALQTELRASAISSDETIDLAEVRRRRDELARELNATERALTEATTALTQPPHRLAASA